MSKEKDVRDHLVTFTTVISLIAIRYIFMCAVEFLENKRMIDARFGFVRGNSMLCAFVMAVPNLKLAFFVCSFAA